MSQKSIADAKAELGEVTKRHIEEILETKPPPPPNSLVVLEPTWSQEGERVLLLSDQVVIVATRLFLSSVHPIDGTVTFDINISGEQKDPFKDVKRGERRVFAYKENKYILECMGFRSSITTPETPDGVQIRVLRQL